MNDNEESSELPTSQLGTKEYWDSSYQLELENFKDHGDVGEVWFGEDSALRVVRYLTSSVEPNDSIIDLGCGNGMLLVELAKEGFTNLLGVDYSEAAIKLAQAVATSEELNIKFETCDILSNEEQPLHGKKFKIVIDKGTYDAISLNPENTTDKRISYINAVNSILDEDGIFVLTSCNWTQSELENHFKTYFFIHRVLPTPKFQFGGKTGNTVTSVVFKRNYISCEKSEEALKKK